MANNELGVMKEMLKWLEFMGRQEAVGVVTEALDFGGDEKREQAAKVAYQLTNGERSTRDIEEYVPFGRGWVSDRHQEWATLGIVRQSGPQGSYEHIISLDELGIDYPDLPEAEA